MADATAYIRFLKNENVSHACLQSLVGLSDRAHGEAHVLLGIHC